MRLRDYQAKALQGIHDQFEQNDSTLLVLATGLGKTVIVSHLVKDYLDKGRIMMLAHREELIGQAWRTLKRVTGIEPDTEMGDYHANSYGAFRSDIVVGTIQTQNAGRGMGLKRMTKFDPSDFSLLIIDEGHHAAAASYRRVIEYYQRNPKLKVIYLTATPDRADEKALGQFIDSVAYEYDLREGVDDGWLVPITQQSVYVDGLDYSSIRTTAGDLNGKDLARVLEFEEMLHGFCSPTIEIAGDKKTLIFAASCEQASRMTEILNRHKTGSARYVHGGTPKEERRELWPAYTAGEFQYLVNVGITTEGWDEPSVEVVVMARPTKSRRLMAQMLGRGTRALPNLIEDCAGADARKLAIAGSDKSELLVLDFVGNCGRHKLITPPDILGGKYEDDIVDRAKKNAEKDSAQSGIPVDVIEQLELAEKQLAQEKAEAEERDSRQKIKLRAKYSTAKVNPFEMYNIQPWREKGWHKGRQPSEKQVALLERNGIDVNGLSFTHASQLIDRVIRNTKEGKASYKMLKCLQRYGFNPDMEFSKARIVMDALSANSWRPLQPEQKAKVLQEIGA